jgi:flagellar M-ring protein FliF
MPDWRALIQSLQAKAATLPKLAWAIGGVILVSLGAVAWLEMSGPPYAVLDEGLSPADGGKVIAQLQKLSIPYQLQAAGNIILVPAPDLAQARLQLGASQVPGSDVATAWAQLENAPMTSSDLAQSTMQMQALQLSLQQSITQMAGISSAQVFLAIPADTPFLADQPKPTAAVIIAADEASAQAQGEAIANLVAGAVPGLAAAQVNVETTAGVSVYPLGGAARSGTQLATIAQVEAIATARIAGLLIPLVGAGNFETNVSANVDFTQERTHQVAYGPAHLIAHQVSAQSDQSGAPTAAIGIPGALSNEPPSQTTATPDTSAAAHQGQTPGQSAAQPPNQPHQSNSNLDQTYVTDESDSDITRPDWVVNGIAVSVVLNKASLADVTTTQIKTAIAGAFAYPQVNVNVLAASFAKPAGNLAAAPIAADIAPLAHGMLELMAAAALLFGLALPAPRHAEPAGAVAAAPAHEDGAAATGFRGAARPGRRECRGCRPPAPKLGGRE